MIRYKHTKYLHTDLTKVDRSVGKLIEPLITNVLDYPNVTALKDAFIEIIEHPKTHISKNKIFTYLDQLEHIRSLAKMQSFLTNIYCKSANLGLD